MFVQGIRSVSLRNSVCFPMRGPTGKEAVASNCCFKRDKAGLSLDVRQEVHSGNTLQATQQGEVYMRALKEGCFITASSLKDMTSLRYFLDFRFNGDQQKLLQALEEHE